ncbi:hypothetical protein J6Z39_10405 [bacterium]|nr:hypothetical protein [bacterium]
MSVFETRGIAPKVVEALQRDEELFKVAESILERVSVNTNTFKNLVRDLREISLRDGCSYTELLKKVDAESLLNDPQISEKGRGEELLSRLYNLRYPYWSRKQAEFLRLKSRFAAQTGGEITFPDFAEGNSFKVSFTVKTAEDIKDFKQKIDGAGPLLEEALKAIKE